MHIHVEARSQHQVVPQEPPTLCLRQRFLLGPGTPRVAEASWPMSPGIRCLPLFPPLLPQHRETKLKIHATPIGFVCGFLELNSGPHTHGTNTLVNELSSQPFEVQDYIP